MVTRKDTQRRSHKIQTPTKKGVIDTTIIGEEALGVPDNIKVICNYCNLDTNVRIDKETFWYNRCQVPIVITAEDVRNYYDLQVPQGPSNEPLVGTIPSPGIDTVQIKKRAELQGGFKALKDKGLNVTNYQEYNLT
jgi:hypothetical protein